MRNVSYAICAAAVLVAGSSPAASAGPCGLSEINSTRELHQFLSMRAVEVVERAARSEARNDLHLRQMISPSASFSLGAGDVGRPLGTGVDGARALAETMKADTYRYLGWDYMDGPAKACSAQKVTVEFVDTASKHLSSVEFTFDAGRVVSAAGWSRSFEAGPLKGTRPSQ
jgi:hypothetical protein